MNKNVQRIAGLVLILAGLSSYFLNPDRPMTALIGPFFGVAIIILSIGLDGSRNKAYWTSLVLSLLFGIMTASMALKSYSLEDSPKKIRRISVFWTMSFACLGNSAYLLTKFKSKPAN